MDDTRSEQYLKPYREALAEHGAGFKATLWGSREAQALRFDVMIELAGLEDCVIVDVGCGQGDFAARLIERGVGFRRYVGLDALPEMVEKGAARELARCEFRAVDAAAAPTSLAVPGADFACLSGTLNTMDDEGARELVTASFEQVAQGVVFNFLGDRFHPRWAGKDLTPARRFDTVDWIGWAMGLTSRVRVAQDYLDGHDVTILALHDEGVER